MTEETTEVRATRYLCYCSPGDQSRHITGEDGPAPLPLKPMGGFHSPPHGFGILRHGSFASVVRHTAGILSGDTVPRQANVAPHLDWGSRLIWWWPIPTSAALRQHRLSGCPRLVLSPPRRASLLRWPHPTILVCIFERHKWSIWLRRLDLNQRPSAYEADALPTALLRQTVGAFCSKVPRPREVRPRWPCPQCNCHLRQLRFGPVKVGPHLIAFNVNLDVRSCFRPNNCTLAKGVPVCNQPLRYFKCTNSSTPMCRWWTWRVLPPRHAHISTDRYTIIHPPRPLTRK